MFDRPRTIGNHPLRLRRNVPAASKMRDTTEASKRDISPAGIGRCLVLFIKPSRLLSWIWLRTVVPAASKNTPLNRNNTATDGVLPVRKYPVVAEMATINDKRILVSLIKILEYILMLFLSTCSFKIIHNFINILSF